MTRRYIHGWLVCLMKFSMTMTIVVTPQLAAKDVDGWDSLTHIRLILSVEKAFKIKFTTSEIGNLENVGDLVALIRARV